VKVSLSSSSARIVSRRTFTQSAAMAAAAVATHLSHADQTENANTSGLAKSDWDEVQARLTNLVRVYGIRLSELERKRCLKILIANQQMLASIRAFAVQNSDAAALTLQLAP
jgi:hypothetical protein